MAGLTAAGFERLLNPHSIAIVGASERGFSSRNALDNLRSIGYPGEILPVNPRHATVFGMPSHASLRDCPPVDVVFGLVSRNATENLVADAIAAGAGGLVLPVGGFKESGDPDWVAREARIGTMASEAGLPIIGPNSVGMFSGTSRALLSVGPYPWDIESGSVALLFQSGGQMMAACRSVTHLGAGVAYAFSLGNAANTGFAELITAMVEQPSVREIVLLIEEIPDWAAFRTAASAAIAAGKWIGATSIGATELGREAARTHTGALATDANVLRAGLEQLGVAYADSPSTLVAAAALHARLGPARLGGVGMVGVSGGAAGLSADLADGAGLPLAALSAETRRRIAAANPEITPRNPLDVVNGPADRKMFRAVFDAFLAEPDVAVTVYLPSQGLPDDTLPAHSEVIENVVAAAETLDRPVVISQLLTVPTPDLQRTALNAHRNVCFLPSATEALAALAVWRSGLPAPEPAPPARAQPPHLALEEHDAKALLREFGCAVPESVFVPAGSAAEVNGLRFPVVAKGMARSVLHKAAAGLVRLGIADHDELAAVLDRLRPVAEDVAYSGFLVEEQVPAGFDLMISVRRTRLGSVVVLAEGGAGAGGEPARSWLGVEPTDAEVRTGLVSLSGRLGVPLTGTQLGAVVSFTGRLRAAFAAHDWSLLEVNPVRVHGDAHVVALDAVVLGR